ncbi:hypothetical protein OG288_02355 [Streptomyces tauricus]|uniref:Uncharacterized protein n=1 Tax=Streptomyces tauricus TaxID=68274 RepID=A0ABZ1J6U6_9ACTN|nr:hypothetical protein [Streptomyces tauricus]
MKAPLGRRVTAEAIGTGLLVTVVVETGPPHDEPDPEPELEPAPS